MFVLLCDKSLSSTLQFFPFLVCPEMIVFRADVLLQMFHLFSYFSLPRYLQAVLADRREILHHDWKCLLFYNAGPKQWHHCSKSLEVSLIFEGLSLT